MRYPEIIFTRDDCEKLGNHLRKPIVNMLKNPILSGTGIEDVFILDDRASTFSANPDNGILIPAYTPNDNIVDLRKDDRYLTDLIRWFGYPEVARSPDVRSIDKNRIFG